MAVEHHEPASAAVRDHAPFPAGPRADDPEVGIKRTPSPPPRVSLPPSRSTSMHSHTASAQGDGDGDDDDTDSEFPWGPSHPCFPHPNPHVPLHTEIYDNTRIIRVKRDWMVKGDIAPTFANLYPQILDPLVTEDEFRKIIKKINDALLDAHDPFTLRAWLDSALGVATAWLWEDLGLTKVKQKLGALERWIEQWNRSVGQEQGVQIVSLRRTGYLTLDIQIPDPQLGPDTSSTRPNTQQDDLMSAAPPTLHFDAGSPIAIDVRS
ncbi:Golgin subfamily A member 7/ERF4 family-domain-containing protein [Massariosphaeria phaeospora]|uniref:Ras modification protein ERF4 n=1 Tax=Massariosphaeria phaeospora TaxID=100035 RepID=A0A7C8M3D8_9PLEO|nr:Golgin subfamily A member 7/ERF4 family-domain-containing protein [Massariosphaeria phaeospora]